MSTTPTVKPLKGKPTCAGWYWVTGINGGSAWFIAEVRKADHPTVDRRETCRFHMRLLTWCDDSAYDATVWLTSIHDDWTWYGPLTPPRPSLPPRKRRVHSQGGTIDGAANLREHHFPGL